MAGIDAPYQTGTELTQMPGDAALSGVQNDFDPSNKQPFAALQNTSDRLEAESNQAIQQQRAQQFQAQQAAQQQQHDLLTRHMAYDHEDKVKKYDESMKARERLFGYFNQGGGGRSSATLKDSQGNDMSIPFLPQDNEKLVKETNEFQKWAMSDPAKNIYSPELSEKMNDLQQKRSNASLRTIYAKQAEQTLNQTYDPQERQRLQSYISKLQEEPVSATSMPHPFVELPTIKPLIDVEKEYKDGKGYEEFEEGTGVPNSRYLGLGATTNPQMINEGFKRYDFFKNQPEGQSLEAYNAWKDKLDALTKSRGLPEIDLPVHSTQDGQIVFDDDTYAKKQQIARKMLVATELMNNGYLKKADEEDVLKVDKMKAEVEKDKAMALKENVEAQIKQKELATGKSAKPTKEEIVEQQNIKAVKGIYGDVQKVFSTSGKKEIYTSSITKDALKYVGINPDEYKIYAAPNSDKYIGIEAPEHTVTEDPSSANGKKKTVDKSIKGASHKAEGVFLVENKSNHEKELLYIDKGKIISRVPEKTAIINGIKHEAKYIPSEYGGKVAQVEDIYGNAEKEAAKTTSSAASDKEDPLSVIEARLIPVTIKTKDGRLMKVRKDPVTGKRYSI